ncbi:CTLH/CRA C-terminal to lish motif domain-containing protein [Desarmillaria tabescens]|uniref:GID complex catalytic subunit 2 n=1 Tax=Armillaria tabescens TaxID=1929756 RepID=A0AA39KIF2_ARMTA|nr:CTLH/CRA C-terminal to lish motif domain-containing protein [Desarmillaria tabescens]KAK0459673.1 CTLH/CRA C-terminal to lish motif domain-containing protein [Desarmillaria tabescens]
MEAALKELTKLEKLTGDSSAKAKSASISDSLDSLLDSLRTARQLCVEDILPEDARINLSRIVESRKKDIDERQKEIYSSMSRLGKALEKKFTSTLPSYPNLFTSEESVAALERTVVLHFLRTGQFDTAQTLLEESNTDIPSVLREQFIDLHRILQALKDQDTGPALQWARENRDFLKSRASPLEFYLHRSQYVRLLLSSHPPDPRPALAYANSSMRMFYDHHEDEFKRLMACLAFLPLSRLKTSPYADLASPSLHWDLEPLFAKEYCASLGMSKQVPLNVVTEIGGGGALAKIEKGKRVMRERKSEWSQADELPIEIPVPSENRYHSIFTCPVSKEQSTESNPPMMMACGHVIARDSLQKLSKPGGRVKCPYCPTESQASAALPVYF